MEPILAQLAGAFASPEVLVPGGLAASGLGLYCVKQLVDIKTRLVRIETILTNCRHCRATLPPQDPSE